MDIVQDEDSGSPLKTSLHESPGMHSRTSRARICVFCSTKSGNDGSGPVAARQLAQALDRHKIDLIYGGGTTGLMGELALQRTKLGGPESVLGVIPYALLDRERDVNGNLTAKNKFVGFLSNLGIRNMRSIAGKEDLGSDVQDLPTDPRYGRVVGVSSLGRRKAVMMSLVHRGGPGSGFVCLPGGLGTLDELVEVVTHRGLGVHKLPVVLVNVNGFWDGMKMWIETAAAKGYLSDDVMDMVKVVPTAEDAVEYLRRYKY